MTQSVERVSGVEPASCRLSIFPSRQDAHPTDMHAEWASDVEWAFWWNLLRLMPARHGCRGNRKRVSSTGSSEIYPGKSRAIRDQKGILTF
ncbi:MAG: hypothetical protein F6K37_35475 [Moorea sp. SIO4E2]|nr:hypothetical protein [Moorena sp. SIO4E2]